MMKSVRAWITEQKEKARLQLEDKRLVTTRAGRFSFGFSYHSPNSSVFLSGQLNDTRLIMSGADDVALYVIADPEALDLIRFASACTASILGPGYSRWDPEYAAVRLRETLRAHDPLCVARTWENTEALSWFEWMGWWHLFGPLYQKVITTKPEQFGFFPAPACVLHYIAFRKAIKFKASDSRGSTERAPLGLMPVYQDGPEDRPIFTNERPRRKENG
jgi:hypothetical protein